MHGASGMGCCQQGRLPCIDRAGDVHGYATRSARTGMALTARDHGMVGYRVPKEWATLTEEQRGLGLFAAFKRESQEGFLEEYGVFVCCLAGCGVCQSDS